MGTWIDRFIEKIHFNGEKCWIWKGVKNSGGYGYLMVSKKREKAHRVSWTLFRGKIPNGIHVLHKCDNPSCVNPNHLFLGTHQDNMKDRDKKGRLKIVSPIGIKNGRKRG